MLHAFSSPWRVARSLRPVRLPRIFSPNRRFSGADPSACLTQEQTEFQAAARRFAKEEMAPHAAEWDLMHHFPEDTLRRAAALGFGGIYVREDVGGAGLGRKDAAIVFEELAKVANQALQLHGGYGYLMDYPIERYVRDLRVHQILEGTNEIMRVIVSRELLKD